MSIYVKRMMRVAREVSLSDPQMGHDLEMNIRKVAILFGGPKTTKFESGLGGGGPKKLRHIYFDKYKKAFEGFAKFAKSELDYLNGVKETFEYEEKGEWPKEIAAKIGYDLKKGESLQTPDHPVGKSLLEEVLRIEQATSGRTASFGKRLVFLRNKSRHHLALLKGIKEKIKGLFKGKEKPLEDIDLLEQGISYKNGVPQTNMESFQKELDEIIKRCQKDLSRLSQKKKEYKRSYSELRRSPSYDKLMKCIEGASELETEGILALVDLLDLEEKLVPKKTDAKQIDPRKTTKDGLPLVKVPEEDEELETEFFGSPLGKPSTLTIKQKAKRLVDDPESEDELESARELYYSLEEMLKRKNAL